MIWSLRRIIRGKSSQIPLKIHDLWEEIWRNWMVYMSFFLSVTELEVHRRLIVKWNVRSCELGSKQNMQRLKTENKATEIKKDWWCSLICNCLIISVRCWQIVHTFTGTVLIFLFFWLGKINRIINVFKIVPLTNLFPSNFKKGYKKVILILPFI